MSYNPINIDELMDKENHICPFCGAKNFVHLIQDRYTLNPSVTLEVKCLFCYKEYEIYFPKEEVKKYFEKDYCYQNTKQYRDYLKSKSLSDSTI